MRIVPKFFLLLTRCLPDRRTLWMAQPNSLKTWRARRDSNSRPLPSECNGLLLIGNRRHENAQQAGPACPAIDLEKNWRRKEEQLAYSIQAIDLIGAP